MPLTRGPDDPVEACELNGVDCAKSGDGVWTGCGDVTGGMIWLPKPRFRPPRFLRQERPVPGSESVM